MLLGKQLYQLRCLFEEHLQKTEEARYAGEANVMIKDAP